MEELRAILLVGAAVALMTMQVHSQTAEAKMAKPSSAIDGAVMDGTVMDESFITEMEADKTSVPMCCQSRSYAGCPCRKANQKYYLEFLETLQRRRDEGDDGDLGDDILRKIPIDEENETFTMNFLDRMICRVAFC